MAQLRTSLHAAREEALRLGTAAEKRATLGACCACSAALACLCYPINGALHAEQSSSSKQGIAETPWRALRPLPPPLPQSMHAETQLREQQGLAGAARQAAEAATREREPLERRRASLQGCVCMLCGWEGASSNFLVTQAVGGKASRSPHPSPPWSPCSEREARRAEMRQRETGECCGAHARTGSAVEKA